MRKPAGTNLSNVSYYLDNLEISFTEFLRRSGTSEKTRKNYLGDARHFLSWSIVTLESLGRPIETNHINFLAFLTPHMVEGYKKYLLQNRVPVSTINRRLSTIRSFFRFCHIQGWITQNPTQYLTNIPSPKKEYIATDELIDAFRNDLVQEGASKATVKNYSSDVRQFLEWLERRRQTT